MFFLFRKCFSVSHSHKNTHALWLAFSDGWAHFQSSNVYLPNEFFLRNDNKLSEYAVHRYESRYQWISEVIAKLFCKLACGIRLCLCWWMKMIFSANVNLINNIISCCKRSHILISIAIVCNIPTWNGYPSCKESEASPSTEREIGCTVYAIFKCFATWATARQWIDCDAAAAHSFTMNQRTLKRK